MIADDDRAVLACVQGSPMATARDVAVACFGDGRARSPGRTAVARALARLEAAGAVRRAPTCGAAFAYRYFTP